MLFCIYCPSASDLFIVGVEKLCSGRKLTICFFSVSERQVCYSVNRV